MNGNIHPEAAQLRETLCADDIMENEEEDQKAGGEKVEKAEIKDGSMEVDKGEYRVYTMRWVILAMFVFYSASNAFQWTQLVIITSILRKYYDISNMAVYWTSMIYMVLYIPLIFPASWLLDKKGLRLGVLLGSAGTCLGSWIKVCGTGPDQWWIAFTGQTVVATSQIFILGIPAQLAATWFPPSQTSTATSIGVFGNQLGIAVGFVLPAVLVGDQDDEANYHLIGHDLFVMFLGVAIFTTILLISIIFVENAIDKQEMKQNNEESYLMSIKNLCTNPGYWLLLITYGINVGVFYAVSTLLNDTVTKYFDYEGVTEDAGMIGLVIVVCGMAGSMVGGIILDKTHAYKATTLAVYFMSFIGMVLYTFTFRLESIGVVYFTSGLLGFFMTGYLPLGFEFAAEITFPESEGTSSGLLNASAQVFGLLCTSLGEWIYRQTEDYSITNSCLAALLVLGTIMTGLIRPDYRRQRAINKETEKKQDTVKA